MRRPPPITPEQDRAYCESKGRVLGEDPPACPRWDDALCGSDGPCPSCPAWEDEVSLGVPERPSDDPWQAVVELDACEVCADRRLVFAWLPHSPGRRSITRCPACITAGEVGG